MQIVNVSRLPNGLELVEATGEWARMFFWRWQDRLYSLTLPWTNSRQQRDTLLEILDTLVLVQGETAFPIPLAVPVAVERTRPPRRSADSPVPDSPAMLFPWDSALSIRYTGGPHGDPWIICSQTAWSGYEGIDFGMVLQEVLAVAGGTILSTGSDSIHGYYVIVDHGGGWTTHYWHLDSIDGSISPGVVVAQGRVLGVSGNTGSGANGAYHLHLSLRQNGVSYSWNGVDIDGWKVRSDLVSSNTDQGYNYQGTMTQGSESYTTISECGGQALEHHGSTATAYADVSNGTLLSSSNHKNYGGGDTTPPTAGWISPSDGQVISSGVVHLEANASDDSSGVNRVSFTAKWNGNWYGLTVVTSSPYQYDWDWCSSGVPDGDVELGLEAWDNAGNHYVYSEHYPNYHITKSYSCSPSCSPNSDQVALYADTNYGGSCVTLGIGDYPNPGTLGAVGNDNAESVRVGSNVQAVLCQNDNFEGTCETFTGDDSNLADNPIGANIVSSARVQQRTQAPAAPTLQSPGNGSTYNEGTDLSLSWNGVSGATEYYAEFWGGPAGTLNSGWQGATSWQIGSQWSGYTYFWHVRARNGSGESSWSDSWSVTVKPTPPSNLQAQAASCTQVNLSWSDNSGNEEGYRIYRDGSYVGAAGMNGTSYQDSGVAPSTSFSYAVRAFRGGIESDPATASTSTPPCSGAAYQAYLPVIAKVQHEQGQLAVYSHPVDGEVGNAWCSEWGSCRNAASGNLAYSDLEYGTVSAGYSQVDYDVKRLFLFFDTAALPANATVTAATLHLYAGPWQDGATTLHVVPATAWWPLDGSSFSQVQFLSGGSAAPGPDSWFSIPLNPAALGWVVPGGVTRLALIHDLDLRNIVPTDANNLIVSLAEDGSYQPYLVVAYTVP
jgi:hypothetical protein